MNKSEIEVVGRAELEPTARLILLAIGKGEVRTEALTRLAGVSRATLYRALNRLVAVGMVERRHGYVRLKQQEHFDAA